MCPAFFTKKRTQEVPSMPGIYRWNLDEASSYIETLSDLGITAFLLFGIPERKDEKGSEAWSRKGVVQEAITILRDSFPDIILISDVCLCQYTTHGHCGMLTSDGLIDNDSTLELLSRISVSHAEAGVDFVAPSDMMDSRVHSIRENLDIAGYSQTGILSYSVKYNSAFYGPFRDAADSSPKHGDRSTYQMDYRNRREALREIELDVREGADIVMVKPALAYLDIIQEVSRRGGVPVGAYNVSGEYSMIKAASINGWIDEDRAMFEIISAIKRAGADLIFTYFAERMGQILP